MVGVCTCEQHGRAGLADVCVHVAEAVSAQSRVPDVVSASFRMGRFGSQADAEIVLMLTYCLMCARDHGFPTHNCNLPETEWEDVFGKGQFTGVCADCLKEATHFDVA